MSRIVENSVAPGTERGNTTTASGRNQLKGSKIGFALLIAIGLSFGTSRLVIAGQEEVHKSLPRLRTGLKSVKFAKQKAQSRLEQVAKEQTQIESRLKTLKSDIRRQELINPDIEGELDELQSNLKALRTAKSKVCDRIPRDRDAMHQYLVGMVNDGAGKYISPAIAINYANTVVLSKQDLREEVLTFDSPEELRRCYDRAIAKVQQQIKGLQEDVEPTTNRLAELATEQTELKKQLAALDDEENALQKKIQKCNLDEKHILAEIKVVTELKQKSSEADHEKSDQDEVESHQDSEQTQSSKVVFKNMFRPVAGRVTSLYGMRIHPIHQVDKMHYGIDLAGAIGDPVYAANEGTITFARAQRGYGNLILIEHRNGITTAYGHLSEILVTEGAKVKRGDTIAAVGNLGVSTGPHLHFEVRKNNKPVDPLPYL